MRVSQAGRFMFCPHLSSRKETRAVEGKIVYFLKRQVSVANCVKMTIVNNKSGGPVGGECERARSLLYQREEFQKNMVKSEAFCHMAIHSFSVCRQRGD